MSTRFYELTIYLVKERGQYGEMLIQILVLAFSFVFDPLSDCVSLNISSHSLSA